MTVEQAREEIPNFDVFKSMACVMCNNDWYCSTPCEMLLKAEQIEYDRILKCYAKHDGDWQKVDRYINNTKINRTKGGY